MPPAHDPVTGHALRAGMLLLAGPRLTDASFARSVVLLLDHDAEGAVGVVVNRPTRARLGEAMPLAALEGFGAATDAIRATPVMEGGPVDRSQLLALVTWQPGWSPADDRLREVLPGLGLVDIVGLAASGEGAADPAWRTAPVRAYVGYAGWGPGQLEDEVAEEAWYVLPGVAADPFTPEPALLWQQVVDRQPGRLAWLGLRPADVARN